MAIKISGTTGIDMGNTPVSNASQVDSVVVNENGSNVINQGELAYDVNTSSHISNTLASGAIIERGSNANGEYIKFADGTLICTLIGVTIPYRNPTWLEYDWTFPMAFISIPFSSWSYRGNILNQINWPVAYRVGGLSISVPTNLRASLSLYPPLGSNWAIDSASTDARAYAIGRWK